MTAPREHPPQGHTPPEHTPPEHTPPEDTPPEHTPPETPSVRPTLPVPRAPHLAEAETFWEGVAAGTFLLERCRRCAKVVWYPRGFCPSCASADIEHVPACGRGTVYSYSVVHRGAGEYRGREPYIVAYVELEEGPRVLTNLVGCDPDSLTIGTRVQMVFELGDDGAALYRFTLA